MAESTIVRVHRRHDFGAICHAALYYFVSSTQLPSDLLDYWGSESRYQCSALLGYAIGLPPDENEQRRHRQLPRPRDGENTTLLVAKKRTLIERLKEKRTALISRTVTRGLPPNDARAAGLDPHPKLKPTGIEWLGEVPEHWAVKAIKRESTVLRGASPRPIDNEIYFDEEGEYAWVRIADVSAAGMYLRETTQQLSDLGQSLSVSLEPGSLFLSIAGTVGKPCITGIKCCIHDGFVYFPSWRRIAFSLLPLRIRRTVQGSWESSAPNSI